MSTKKGNFASQVLGELNKDEQTVQKESVNDIVADYVIQVETQISFLKTGTIPQLNLKLNQQKRELDKATKNVEKTYLDLKNGDFKSYIGSITTSEDVLEDAKHAIAEIENEIAESNSQIKKFQNLLEKLQS